MAETSTIHSQAGPEHPTAPQEAQRFPVLWERLALGSILLLATLLDFYKLGQDGFGSYYPPAVLSMMDNWHNFFFAAYDPGGFTSLDKPPVGFWFQVLSAKIFGLNTVSVLLPQALAGVLSVLLLYYLVRRHFGVVAGLLSALALAISPVSVVTNRNETIDSTLILFLLLGAWAVMRAAETGRLRWLLFSALFVGIGFNIKMLEAYLVVPAFGLLYLLAAPTSLKKRVLHLALALLVLLVVSFSWVLAVDLTPASQRPYVGNMVSQDDSELSLALGYNGLQRLGLGTANQRDCPDCHADPLRLFLEEPLAGQTGWLLPLELLGLVALAWQGRPRPREDRRMQSLLLWGMWLLPMGIIFSAVDPRHEYYVTVMAPAIAALCGIGLVVMWRDYRGGGWRGWLLPLALLLTAAAQIVILTNYPAWGKFLIPLLLIPCLLAAGVLIGARLAFRWMGKAKAVRLLWPAVAVGLVALLLAPTIWAAIPILQGTESDLPLAGPGGPTIQSTSVDPVLIRYLEEHQGHARALVAIDTLITNPNALILATNKPVIPLNYFSTYPLTITELQSLVANGTVRFFLLWQGPALKGGRSGSSDPLSNSVRSWVAQHCATVPPSLWQSSSSSYEGSAAVLYNCDLLH
ncbi:glycosyltransferase family 39 protein [Ktedonobacter racemifer]|uniref:Glycosyl transferase family 39 n=1 Tax=Ktedonobacter racemifer DSM 44963 TaxID=485913 RepID=D6U1C4_KTERA|nr:glycosyltransferase family 39 protein [Ktedonobacter racemifer]EFH80775.1 glycosyl transferase family 39 [Ktedonobacter racemifer DSM 44963]